MIKTAKQVRETDLPRNYSPIILEKSKICADHMGHLCARFVPEPAAEPRL